MLKTHPGQSLAHQNPSPQDRYAMQQARELDAMAKAMLRPDEASHVKVIWRSGDGYQFYFHEGAWWLGENQETASRKLRRVIAEDLHLQRAVRPEYRRQSGQLSLAG